MSYAKEMQPWPYFTLLLLLFSMLLLLLLAEIANGQQRPDISSTLRCARCDVEETDSSSAESKANEDENPPHINTALEYFGPQDQPGRDNFGPNIKLWLNSVGLNQGNPYCAAFASWCMDQGGVETPEVRSALASNFITSKSIDAKQIMYGQCVPAGSLLIWRKGNTIFGHVGFVLFDWCGASGMTIEGNTTVGGGSNIEGVWIRKRTIYPANYFRITDFTNVQYN